MEIDLLGIQGLARLLRRGAVTASCRATFASLKAALVVKKEASCC